MKKLLLAIVISLMFAISLSAGQVLLDHVEGTWFDGASYKIIPGSPVKFHLRIINDENQTITSMSNGFRISGGAGDFMVGSSIFPTLFTPIENYGNVTGFRVNSTIPAGFNEVAFWLQTGNFIEGSFICLDSTFFGTSGTWVWSGAVSNVFPTWDGPHCFAVETPCYPPVFVSCPDTLSILNCYYTHEFLANIDSSNNSVVRYLVTDGPGSINENDGRWQYMPLPSDYGTTQTITIKAYNINCPSSFSLCTTTLTFTDSLVVGDLNFDCFIDIADLVYMVDFMFQGGPEPQNYNSFDVNGDGKFDIADLVYLVEYMFNSGPPPIG